jgi:CrcB protein
MLQRFPLAAEYRAAVPVGFLGAYITFSIFAIKAFYLIEAGSFWKAGINCFSVPPFVWWRCGWA